MSLFDIVYIKGNPSSGSLFQHEEINEVILKLIKMYSYKIIESEHKNLAGIELPKAKIYIGFSRGSRYLNKLPSSCLKISIGGVSGSKVHLFKNKDDNILLGDLSSSSMKAHFIISQEDRTSIKELIANFLK